MKVIFFLLSSLSRSISDMETQKSVTIWEIKSIYIFLDDKEYLTDCLIWKREQVACW